MKKSLCLLLAAIMLLSIPACGTANSDNTPAETDNVSIAERNQNNEVTITETTETTGERLLKVGVSNDPVTFGPWEVSSSGRNSAIYLLYQTLCSSLFDPNTGEYSRYNIIMEDFDHEPGSSEYLVHIRKGIYDTNGNKIDANDVVFSFNNELERGNNSAAKGFTVEVVDDYTVRFDYGKTLDQGQFESSIESTCIVSQASYEASPDGMATTPVGSSGYVLTEYRPGSGFILEKAEREYWNEAANESKNVEDGYCYVYETSNVDKIVFDFIPDTSTMAIALEKGEIDVAQSINAADISLFTEGGEAADYVTVWYVPAATMVLVPNCSENSAMSSLNLRKALYYCFDNASVMMAGYGNDYWLACSPTTNLRSDYNPAYESKDYYDYNLEMAEKYLQAYYDETGTTAKDLHVTLICSNKDEAYKKGAQIIQSYFCNLVGTDSAMEISCLEDTTYKKTYLDSTAFDIALDYEGTEQLYTTTVWRRKLLGVNTSDGLANYFIDDDHLQELVATANSEATYSQENVDAVNDYLIEMGYRYVLGYGTTYRAASSWIGQLVRGTHSGIAFFGCKYDWAAKNNG